MFVNILIIFAIPLASKPKDINKIGPIPATPAISNVTNFFVPSPKPLKASSIFDTNSLIPLVLGKKI
jgi:H+/gluconate symporter-like permease